MAAVLLAVAYGSVPVAALAGVGVAAYRHRARQPEPTMEVSDL